MSYIGNAPIIVADATTPIVVSTATIGTVFVTDTTGYNSISVQITGDWEADTIFQTSNDNLNWVNVQGYAQNSGLTSIDTAVDNDIYLVPVIGRYFQVLISNYMSGTLNITAYLRSQSLAGVGEGMLTQSMDDSTGIAQNVKFPSGLLGQQTARTSIPVALANEQINDLHIIGRQYNVSCPVNTNVLLADAGGGANYTVFIDCLQYRSIAIQTVQVNSVTAGVVTFEASNDGFNWLAYPLYFQSTSGPVYGNQTTSISLGTGGGTSTYYAGPIQYRYFRVRMSTAMASTAATYQVITMLRMSPFTQSSVGQFNLSQINGVIPAGVGVAVTQNPITVGGQDAQSLARRLLTDPSGAVAITGTPATNSEYFPPVQVQEFRTTRGQESTQDILAQVLLELKALTYYIRELPTAIATMSQLPNPQSVAGPASMQDEPESLFRDESVLNNRRG